MKRCRATERTPGKCRFIRQTMRDFFLALLIGLAVFAFAALETGPAQSAPAASSVTRILATMDEPYAPIVRTQVRPDARFLPYPRAAAGTDNPHNARRSGAARFSTIAIMALLFAAMSAMTLGFWRYLAHTVTKPARARENSQATISVRRRRR